jgi:sec-independent protein translocase protein TatC
MRKSKQRKLNNTASSKTTPKTQTFMEHVRELRGRLVWVVLLFVLVTGAAFPFFEDIIKLLMKPLGNEKLYYLTPIGGVSFAIKVCMYVGMIATIPVLVYHLYQFISPVMKRRSAKRAILYVLLSTSLAAIGIIFAYLVTLPSAMHFLTGFTIGGVSAMLTVDSYLSFIVAYVLASALMFQVPLVMVIIDRITPMPPSSWNKYQRHMIVGAFIIAMLITPSPEITTQFTLAAPTILMYQIGILLVWIRHRQLKPKTLAVDTLEQELVEEVVKPHPQPVLEQSTPPVVVTAPQLRPTGITPGRVDVLMRYRPARARNMTVAVPPRQKSQDALVAQMRPQMSGNPAKRVSIDGFFPASDT